MEIPEVNEAIIAFKNSESGMVAHTCNTSTWEAEAGG
jgi:hypothetical protein